MSVSGVYQSKKQDGTLYFRSSVTYHNKHISLGSFSSLEKAHQCYQEALYLLENKGCQIDDYSSDFSLSFSKWVVLINYRDNGLYIKNPIYLKNHYFLYYYNQDTVLKFDIDDLFYYSNHKIMKRGGHLFVSDFGMQFNILARYGIKNYAVKNRDYRFVNGDDCDFRYGNIEIINKYYGVLHEIKKGRSIYTAKIHVIGDFLIGRYATEIEAAIAYNKAANLLTSKGVKRQYTHNFILEIDAIEYAKIYNSVRINRKIREYQLK